MATSGTFAFRLSAEEMIVEAFERCGIDPQDLTGYDAKSARRSMGLLFSEWAVRGVNYWTTDEQSQTVTQGTATYALADGTLDVLSMVLRRSSTDTVMDRIALTEYHELPNKSAQGRPTTFWFDRQYTPNVTVWQTPENSTDALVYWRVVQVEDVGASSNDVDIPYRWTEALCAGLAVKLAQKKKPELYEMLLLASERAFSFARDDERDRATLRIIPVTAL